MIGGEQWKALAKDLFNELLEIDSDNTIDSYLSYEALEKINGNNLKINRYEQIAIFRFRDNRC